MRLFYLKTISGSYVGVISPKCASPTIRTTKSKGQAIIHTEEELPTVAAVLLKSGILFNKEEVVREKVEALV